MAKFETRYQEDTNQVLSKLIWEFVKAGDCSYNLLEIPGIRAKDIPDDQGPTRIDVKVKQLFRKTQKDDWVSITDFLKQPGVTPFGKVSYTTKYDVTIEVSAQDKWGDEWTVGRVKFWFSKKCNDMADSMLGGALMDYDRLASDLEVSGPANHIGNPQYYQNLMVCWCILADKVVKVENQQKQDKLFALLDAM